MSFSDLAYFIKNNPNKSLDSQKYSIIHNEDALNCLLLATSRSEMFQRIWSKNDKLSFMCLFHQERFDKGDILVEHGSVLSKFYVVDEGAFEVLIPKEHALQNHETHHSYDMYKDDSAWTCETVLYENEHFGEPALECAVLSRMRRVIKSPFRIRCSFPSRVWCVNAEKFLTRWDVMQEALSKEIRSSMIKVPMLSAYMASHPERERDIIQKCKVVDLGPEECIIRESFTGHHMYVLLKGHGTRYVEDGTNNPTHRIIGTYTPDNPIFGLESLKGEPYCESVVISSRRAKIVVIPARIDMKE
mmetsp:Transcript_11149/g.41643  ORF Transcript_11149/g.41643 Transcript_11149/m.41643 type:complete len:302 (-) Transcript_11149:2029-2934(-)